MFAVAQSLPASPWKSIHASIRRPSRSRSMSASELRGLPGFAGTTKYSNDSLSAAPTESAAMAAKTAIPAKRISFLLQRHSRLFTQNTRNVFEQVFEAVFPDHIVVFNANTALQRSGVNAGF